MLNSSPIQCISSTCIHVQGVWAVFPPDCVKVYSYSSSSDVRSIIIVINIGFLCSRRYSHLEKQHNHKKMVMLLMITLGVYDDVSRCQII